MPSKEAREKLEELFRWAHETHGLNKAKVKEILKENGHEGFVLSKMNVYKATINGYVALKSNLGEKLKKARVRAEKQQSTACDYPDCDGNIVTKPKSRWHVGFPKECDIAGEWHPLLMSVARTAVKAGTAGGRTIEAMALHLESERRKRIETEGEQESQSDETLQAPGVEEVQDSDAPQETIGVDTSDTTRKESVRGTAV